jgi:hypothetical protein
MDGKLLTDLGKIAGVGGIALGVFVVLFRGVLQTEFLPKAGLSPCQAFSVILVLMILTFGIAGIGLIAWLVSRSIAPNGSIPWPTLRALAGLLVIMVGGALFAGAYAADPRCNDRSARCKVQFPPVTMYECEKGFATVCGTWLYNEGTFKATWEHLKQWAIVKVEHPEENQFILRRKDQQPGPEFTGEYVGNVLPTVQADGKCRIEGTVNWFKQGQPYDSGTWNATWSNVE